MSNLENESGVNQNSEILHQLRRIANELEIANDLKVLELNSEQAENHLMTKRGELSSS